jgi:hypothetical protein
VYETMQLMRVQDFSVGGSIHVVVNNQVRLLAVIAATVNNTSSGFPKPMYSYQTVNSSLCYCYTYAHEAFIYFRLLIMLQLQRLLRRST